MAYSFENFCNDVRAMLKDDPTRRGVERIKVNMARLVRDPDFVRQYFNDEIEYGVRKLFVDPELGFDVLGYRCRKPATSPAHDHGESWALYAQVRDYTEMTEYGRQDDGKDPEHAVISVKKQYKLNPGEVGLYWGRELHSTFTPLDSCYLRLTGRDLDQEQRVKIDQATGKILHGKMTRN